MGTAVEGVEGDFKSGGGVLDIEVRDDTGEAGVVVLWTEGFTVVVSVTRDEESDVRVWAVEDSLDISVTLSRSGSSGMLTAA